MVSEGVSEIEPFLSGIGEFHEKLDGVTDRIFFYTVGDGKLGIFYPKKTESIR